MLSHIQSWLASVDPPRNADLIFVLAGLERRKSFALELLRSDVAPRILFSVGRYEIRRFGNLQLPFHLDLLQMAQKVSPPLRHYFVYFADEKCAAQLIPLRRLGTLSEIEALSGWLQDHPEVKSLAVVSSGYHLRRVRMCCRALLPRKIEFRLIAAAEDTSSPEVGSSFLDQGTRSIILVELVKILAYSFALPLRRIAMIWRPKRDKPRAD